MVCLNGCPDCILLFVFSCHSFDEYNDEYEDSFDENGFRVGDSMLQGASLLSFPFQ